MKNYGIFKELCDSNAYSAFARTLNSAKSTLETQKTIKRITHKNIKYAHMGQLVISDGICYATFIQNPGDDTEYHYSTTSSVVLAVFELEKIMSETFSAEADVKIFKVGALGDVCAGHKAISIFKDNSMCLVGNLLYICFSFIAEDEKSHIFCKAFDINSQKWVKESLVTLRYKNENYDFSDETINLIYRDNSLEPRAKGLIEMVSSWNEYNGEYYATGITIEVANNGFIVKTRDFSTMELVDVIPFNDMGMAEIASYIYKDRLFVACRQDYGIPYLYLGSLNLEKMAWEHHYKIPDANSRPWFCEYKGDLILMNTLEEQKRGYMNLSRVRVLQGWPQPFFSDQHPIELLATLKNCGSYIATAEYKGDIYFVVTRDTESFGKLTLSLFDEDKINEKLLSFFD